MIQVKRATGWTAESQEPIGVNATVPGDDTELCGNVKSRRMLVLCRGSRKALRPRDDRTPPNEDSK